jgi:hypothetical protein
MAPAMHAYAYGHRQCTHMRTGTPRLSSHIIKTAEWQQAPHTLLEQYKQAEGIILIPEGLQTMCRLPHPWTSHSQGTVAICTAKGIQPCTRPRKYNSSHIRPRKVKTHTRVGGNSELLYSSRANGAVWSLLSTAATTNGKPKHAQTAAHAVEAYWRSPQASSSITGHARHFGCKQKQ